MTTVIWRFMRASGWSRATLIGACTAVAAGLLLVAVTILKLPANPAESLFELVAETGLRGGTVLAVCLLVLPLLLMLYQVVRLGAAARDRRLAALRLAGATPGEVRLIGALEVGAPVTIGAALGIGVFGLLRLFLGGVRWDDPGAFGSRPRGLMLVPTSVAPEWWQTLLVVAGVAIGGTLTGWWASRHLAVDPLGVTRRQPGSAPRPWGAAPLALAAVAGVVGSSASSHEVTTVTGILAVALAVAGILGLTSWAAYRVARSVEVRADSPATLLAARRLVMDPRPAGRAAAAIGAICMVAGGAAVIGADLGTRVYVDAFMFTSLGLVFAALVAALVVTTFTLVVHLVETLVERRRPLAALVAAGTSLQILDQVQRRELALAAMPTAIGGFLIGAIALGTLGIRNVFAAVIVLLIGGVTLTAVWVAIWIGGRIMRPWLVRVTTPANLRTE